MPKIDEHKEQEIWQMYQQQPTDTNRNRLLEFYLPHLRLVVWGKWRLLPTDVGTQVTMGDLMSEVTIAMMRSIELFDPERGTSFFTYASNRARGAILDFLRKMDHLSRSHRRDKEKHQPLKVSLEKDLGYEEEDSDHSPRVLCDVLAQGQDEHTRQVEMADEVESILASLPCQMATVVAYYYLDGLSMKQTGKVLGLTASRVSQIHTQAMALMREMIKNRDKRESALGDPSG